MTQLGNTLYLGGKFSGIGTYSGGGVAYNASTASADRRFPRIRGAVFAVVEDGQGGFYVGGSFQLVDNLRRQNLVHLRKDGTVDPSFRLGVSGGTDAKVKRLVRNGNTLYVLGQFDSLGTEPRQNLGAIDLTENSVRGWNPPLFGKVHALATANGQVFIGGEYQLNGTWQAIAAFDSASGRVLPWAPLIENLAGGENTLPSITALHYYQGTLYVAGLFTSIGGQERKNLAALDPSTGAATTFGCAVNGPVHHIVRKGSALFIVGDFTLVSKTERAGVASINTITGSPLFWNPDPNGPVHFVGEGANVIYLGGDFTKLGKLERTSLAAVDPFSGKPNDWNPYINGDVHAMALSGDRVYCGGTFNALRMDARQNLAALDLNTGKLKEFNPQADSTVLALSVSNGNLYAGGHFRVIGGQFRHFVACLDANSGAAYPWAPELNKPVRALAPTGALVYVGGDFTRINGKPYDHLAAIDVQTGLPTEWNIPADTSVHALAFRGSAIYVGGKFRTLGGSDIRYLGAINAQTGKLMPYAPQPSGPVVSLLALDDKLVFGGKFNSVGGQPRNGVAAADLQNGRLLDWQADVRGSTVFALAPLDSNVVIGGDFYRTGEVATPNLTVVDSKTGSALTRGYSADGNIYSLFATKNRLFIGGKFTNLNRQGQSNFGALALKPLGLANSQTPEADRSRNRRKP
jgi:hypothetical protein